MGLLSLRRESRPRRPWLGGTGGLLVALVIVLLLILMLARLA